LIGPTRRLLSLRISVGIHSQSSTAAGIVFIAARYHPNPFIMYFIAGTPLGIISDARQIVEIKLWETYLLNDRTNLTIALNQFSIDHGPVENMHHEQGRIAYRFFAEDWENDIKHLLYENRIPVTLKPMLLPAEAIHHSAAVVA
jgi:hypothetical protein